MAKLFRSSVKSPCPICGGVDASCQVAQNHELVMCQVEVNHRAPGEELNGFTYIGVEPSGRWGEWRDKGDDEQLSPQAIHQEVELRNSEFDISKLFHPEIVAGIRDIATIFNQPEAVVATPLLSVISSVIDAGTTIYLGGRTKQAEPPIIWSALTGNSDDGKSPILGILTKPLKTLQAAAWKTYRENLLAHEKAILEWEAKPKADRDVMPKKPNMPHFAVSDFTQEALVNAVQNYPEKGILINVDELGGLFDSFNQYKKSGGGDRKKFLSLYNGSEISVIRKNSEPIYIEHTSISVTGGIQPVVLRNAMGNLDQVDGLWPRFLYARMINSRMPQLDVLGEDDEEESEFDKTLQKACTFIAATLANDKPKTQYRMSPEAKAHWQVWHEITEDARFEHDHPAKIALFRKARSRAARIALVSHIFKAAVNEKHPSAFISGETMLAAIEFTQWGINQILSIYDDYGLSNSPDATRVAKFVTHFKDAGWIDWKRVRSNWSAKEKPNLETCIEFMTTLVTLGYATSDGQPGSKMKISIRKSSHVVTDSANPLTTKENAVTNVSHGIVTTTNPVVTEPKIDKSAVEPESVTGDSVTKPVVTVTKSVTTVTVVPELTSEICDYVTTPIDKNSGEAPTPGPTATEQVPIGQIRLRVGMTVRAVTDALGNRSGQGNLIVEKVSADNKPTVRNKNWHPTLESIEVEPTDVEVIDKI